MTKKVFGVVLAAALSVAMAGSAFAGTWRTGQGSDSGKWWYDNGNGTYPANSWQWIDGDADNQAECYYFDLNGWLVTNTTAPDGSQVNGNGAWVVNGAVQKRNLLASGSGGASGAIDVNSTGYTEALNNVAIDMLGKNRAENAARYGEATAKNRYTYVEVTYSNIPFTAEYENNPGAGNYSGNATGTPNRVLVADGSAAILFREAPEASSANTCREILRARGFDVQKEEPYYVVNIGSYAVYIRPDSQGGYVKVR